VKEIYPLPDGGFEVAVDEGEVEIGESANAQYSFGSDLRLRDAQVTDGYVANFNLLLARGAVKHALDRKAEADQLRHVRYWDGNGFQEKQEPVLASAKK
jgi:environmental stress-induced protein Ves